MSSLHPTVREFIKGLYVCETEMELSGKFLYNAYCKLMDGMSIIPVSRVYFGKSLVSLGLKHRKSNGHQVYRLGPGRVSMREFGFELPIRGRGAGIATFRCHGKQCNATFSTGALDGGGVNPERIANKAKQAGWQAHALAGTKTLCPNCLRRPSTNDPDSELKKVKLTMPTPTINGTPKLPPAIIEHAPAETPRTVTHAQRMAIRDHLDKSFDDELGAYRAGMSDARIAEIVGVARVHVETIRETAYGPIRVDPVMVALRDENAALKGEIEALRSMLDTVGKKSLELGSRIERALAGK